MSNLSGFSKEIFSIMIFTLGVTWDPNVSIGHNFKYVDYYVEYFEHN